MRLTEMDFTPGSGGASRVVILRTQVLSEIVATLRNGEQLLLTIIIPLLILVGASKFRSIGDGAASGVEVATPGVIALAVVSTAFTGLAIATGFERRYRVLKLMGAMPLGRSGLLIAKSAAVLAVEAIQITLIVIVALALGWAPAGGPTAVASSLLLIVMGSITFSALGMLLAGTVRAEAALAAANGIYLLLLVVGGLVIPVSKYPEPMAAVITLLPSAALGEGLRDILIRGASLPIVACAVLIVWGGVAAWLATRFFRWD